MNIAADRKKKDTHSLVIVTKHGTPFRCLGIKYARFRRDRQPSDVI